MMLRKLAGATSPLARSAIGSVVIRAASPVLNLAVSIVLVRLAGSHDYGIYIYCLAMAGLIVQPVTIGLSASLIRHLAIYRMRCEWAYLRGVLRRGFQFSIAASVLLVLIGLLFVIFSLQIAPDSRSTFFVALMLIPLFAFNSFCSSILRGLHHIVWGQIPELIIIPLMLLLIIAVIHGIGLQINSLMLISIQVFVTAWVLLLSVPLVCSRLPREIQGVNPLYEDKYWLRGVLPLLILGGSLQLNTELVVIMLGQINGVENSGIFRLCSRGAEMVYFVIVALNTSIAPTFSRLHAEGNLAELSRLIAKTTRIAILASLPIAFPLIFYSDWVLQFLYGPKFASGASALAILSIGQLVCVITGLVGSLLMMTGFEKDAVKGTLTGLILTLILALLLIPRWGLDGAAAATVAGMIFRNAMNSWNVYQRLGINPVSLFIS